MRATILDPAKTSWSALDEFEDRTVFQTREWVEFVAETQRARPVIAELRDGGEIAGYFTGLTFQRFGIRILGGSFPGWTTPYIGFNLKKGASQGEALEAIERLAFDGLKCLHMEISDRAFTAEDGKALGFEVRYLESYETDLRQSEEEIFRRMTSACRRCIRKAEKSGVTIEETRDPAFADEYYEQLKDVFQKQKLVPTYDLERVRALIRHVAPTGRLLLVRALDPQGRRMGTGIYPGFNKLATFWGNASYRSMQILRPNETLHWYAMRYWKARGMESFDWGGGGTYKEKYGPRPTLTPWFSKSKYKALGSLRNAAKAMVDARQRVLGRLRAAKTSPGSEDHDSEA
jgi:hypothetical protein